MDEKNYQKTKDIVKNLVWDISFYIFYYEELSIVGVEGRRELPPLGTLYIAAALKEVGINVKVVPFTDETVLANISHIDICAYSITSTIVYTHFVDFNNAIKHKYPDCIIIAGNTHANINPHKVVDKLNINGVISGESEYSILLMLINFFTKDRALLFDNVPGAIASSNHFSSNTPVLISKNINVFPFPYRKALPDDYIVLEQRVKVKGYEKLKLTTFLTSRGCPYNCYFCANLNNGHVRYRNNDKISEEILLLKKDYDVNCLLLMDETATVSLNHLRGWTESFAKADLNYILSTRIDALNDIKISLLAQTGCIEIKFGLETGCQELLKKMNKGAISTPEETLYKVKCAGINTKLFLMHGYPGENRITTQKTIEFLTKYRNLIDRVVLYQFTPLPGSYVYNHPHEFNLTSDFTNSTNFTIYNNMQHWWGTKMDYEEMITSYLKLKDFIETSFPR